MKQYYKTNGIPPGEPTMKGSNADPYVADVALPNVELGDYSVPTNWPTNVKFNEPGDVPGPVVQFEDDDQSDVKAGYGFESDNLYEGDWFFFHTDHLGSTSYLTDTAGNVSQFVCYTPYGEAIVDEHLTTYENPFKFSGKELDDITGLYDHGARSRNPVSTLWYGIDPLFEKYPDFSPYNYCGANPARYVDPTGLFKTEKEAISYAETHDASAENVSQAKDKDHLGEWYVTYGDDGKGYVSGGTVERRFGNLPKESTNKTNAVEVTGKVLTSITGVMAFQDAVIGFTEKSLKNVDNAAKTVDGAEKIVKGLSKTSTVIGVVGSGLTIYGGYQNFDNGRIVRGFADMVVGGVGVATPILVSFGLVSNPVGWAIGIGCGVYGISTLIYDVATGQ